MNHALHCAMDSAANHDMIRDEKRTENRSCLYVGKVMHRRHAPREHKLSYRIFSLFLDIDRIDELASRCRWFSRGRFNLYSFRDRDHGDGTATPLRAQITDLLALADVYVPDGKIVLLCMPRILGYAFNPLSVFYCYDAAGGLAALVYEVNNTFGQRHTYVLPVGIDTTSQASPKTSAKDEPGDLHEASGKCIEQHCDKRFHVSPFLDLDMHYRFLVLPPGTRMALTINASTSSGPMLDAVYSAKQQTFCDSTLLRLFATHPLLTLKVVVGIHWEALQIWRKGANYRPCPPMNDPLTIIRRDGTLFEAGSARKTNANADAGVNSPDENAPDGTVFSPPPQSQVPR